MTPADRQAAALDRLRAKGNQLAPVMVDGKVRPKGSNKDPDARGAGRAATASQGAPRVIVPPAFGTELSKRVPGDRFELLIPAPAEFLNENQRLHWAQRAKRVNAWRLEACRLADRAAAPIMLPRLRIDAYVIKPIANRFDPANWMPTAKAVVDGLIDYGIAEDDNRFYLDGPFMHDGGKGEPALRVVVTVLEVMAA